MRVDLHLHTTASDGQHTPAELVALARVHALDIIAICDHDTTAGIAPAQAAAAGQIGIIPAIELSAEEGSGERPVDVHMLGYFIDPDATALQRELREMRAQRETRGQAMLDKLAALGVPVAWERVLAIAGAGSGLGDKPVSIGRPHVARALVEAGHVPDVRAAFDRYLYNGGPAYVARKRLSPEDAIALIHAAGGAAVMAHPGLVSDYLAIAERLVHAGLDGIEVVHPRNSPAVRDNVRGLARRFGLVQTGGSDFHGQAISEVMLGAITPPEGCVAALRERAGRYRAP